jgi:hypothetical protein
MRNTVCWLQMGLVAFVALIASVWIFAPAHFQPNISAEAGISVREYIARLKNGPTEWQRYNAASALGELGDKSAIPYLIDALSSPSEWVRENAASSLGELGAVNAIPDLKKLSSDPSSDVRSNAAQAINDLEGLKNEPSSSFGIFYLLLIAPAIVIVAALLAKLRLLPRFRSNALVRSCLYAAWPLGLLLAWFAQRPYLVTESHKSIGFPFEAAIFNYESGSWVDYIGPLTTPILTLDVVYALFSPQVLLAAILGILFLLSRRRGSA